MTAARVPLLAEGGIDGVADLDAATLVGRLVKAVRPTTSPLEGARTRRVIQTADNGSASTGLHDAARSSAMRTPCSQSTQASWSSRDRSNSGPT